jgi:hypothetical protein
MTSLSASAAPDYRRNQQNWTIRFTKPGSPIFLFQAGASRSCPIHVATRTLGELAQEALEV